MVKTMALSLARSTEKDITGFFEKSACDKAFSGFFINPYCLACMGCDAISFLIANQKRYHVIYASIDGTCFLRLNNYIYQR